MIRPYCNSITSCSRKAHRTSVLEGLEEGCIPVQINGTDVINESTVALGYVEAFDHSGPLLFDPLCIVTDLCVRMTEPQNRKCVLIPQITAGCADSIRVAGQEALQARVKPPNLEEEKIQ